MFHVSLRVCRCNFRELIPTCSELPQLLRGVNTHFHFHLHIACISCNYGNVYFSPSDSPGLLKRYIRPPLPASVLIYM